MYPFQFVVERVAGTHAKVENLTQPGAEPHDLELSPQQVAQVGKADLVVYEKTLQAAVDEAVAQNAGDRALDTATVVPMIPLGEEAHEHEDGSEEGEEHDHGGLDPHIWLDPNNLATVGRAVAERLAAADPDHAADYTENAAALATELTGLDQEYTAGLKQCTIREFITNHAAFGYLAKRYGLEQISISGLSPDAEPSPARIAEIHTEAKEHKITTIFYETLVSPAVAESIAGDLGLKTDVLDPIEGVTQDSRGKDYLEIMRANLTALRSANACQ
ncbi:metal ABC transporter substrate-binding protein [Microlunatus speluncae]|uniref:metal ABC transporter substrate-binding protein n=1 Tax=Microlunatus speluncae TaxID=2594267 RepID=UPI001FE4F55E|nr:metal ABC transporter substrate-binding protein [Microlunatus speluncae]